jgi:co-chaperonin GroES (HSP10)
MKQPTIQPLHDRVLVSVPPSSEEKKKETVVNGIIIPESASEQTHKQLAPPHIIATVLAVGADCKAVKPGDRVVVRKMDLFVMPESVIGKEQTLCFEKTIMAIVR